MEKDYHKISDVNRDSNDDEIEEAYRKLTLKDHPDKNQESNAEENSKEIAEAHEVSTDKKKRDIYDKFGQDGLIKGYGDISNTHQSSESLNINDPYKIFNTSFQATNGGTGADFSNMADREGSSVNHVDEDHNNEFADTALNNEHGSSINTKKKETIMLLSFKRRAELEAKKTLRQEELARIKEQEAIKKESQEQKKLERKRKQELILEQYRRNKKAAEELEKNGSTITTTTINHNNNNHHNNNNNNIGNHHKSSSTGGSATNLSTTSSSSSHVSHQNQNNSHLPHNNTSRIPRDIKSAPSHHTSVWTLYTGPKLFAKPTVKTNLIIIQNAILKSLEGAANAKTLKRMQETIDAHSKTCNHFLILFRNRTSFRGLFQYDEKQNSITRLDGSGPKNINLDDIIKFYKFDSPKRQFSEVQTRQISPTIIAISIQDHLWSRTIT